MGPSKVTLHDPESLTVLIMTNLESVLEVAIDSASESDIKLE